MPPPRNGASDLYNPLHIGRGDSPLTSSSSKPRSMKASSIFKTSLIVVTTIIGTLLVLVLTDNLDMNAIFRAKQQFIDDGGVVTPSEPEAVVCTATGVGAYDNDNAECIPACDGLTLFAQKKDTTNDWKIFAYSTKADCTAEAYGLTECSLFTNTCGAEPDPTPEDPTPEDPVVTGRWSIDRDYNFADDSSARTTLINDVTFGLQDYNNGNVKYVNKPELISQADGKLTMNVGDVISTGCIKSGTNQCIESLKVVFKESLLPNKLIAFRAEEIPTENGAWPAFWLAPATGSWGITAGEIDLYESVNGLDIGVHSTMHSPPGCYMSAAVSGKSSQSQTNCNAGNPLPYEGCGITNYDKRSSKSGTFVLDWQADLASGIGHIKTYWWAYDDLSVYETGGVFSSQPDIDLWDAALYGDFEMGDSCSLDHYSSMNLVLNTQVCGEWAGATYLPGGQSACQAAVATMNKDDLKWVFDDIRIWTDGEDVQVPLYDTDTPVPDPPDACTSEGVEAYSTGSCINACDGLTLFAQKKDTSNDWKIFAYSTKAACTAAAYGGTACADFTGTC